MKAKPKTDAKPVKPRARKSEKTPAQPAAPAAAEPIAKGPAPAQPPVKMPEPVKPAAKPVATPAAPAPQPPAPELKAIRDDLAAMRRMLEQLTAPAAGDDPSLESGVDSMRRLLSDLMDARMDSVIAGVAALRASAADPKGLAERVDTLLEELGAVRFEAERLDFVDPLIHQVVAERRDDAAPEGVVLATVTPGYRTGRGRIVCKAGVVVNRRA